ncbi:MAG TPA: transketolase C-terminal domain-containing protein [Candidatus Limnocylindrales bacterium]|nr:transketolase C-terminal domain-containing protein [Candidatus Limnocylindrales bacterium]
MTRPLRDVWGDALVELARDHPDMLVLDGDLASSTRADRFAQAYPDRFIQMGIAEQGMVGTAVGLAQMGFVPWLSSFTVFFTHRAVDQIRMSVAQTRANVKIGAAYAGLQTGFTGKTHLDVQDFAIMRAMPGMTVLAPADAAECAAMVRWATATPGPVFLRLGRDGGPDVFAAGDVFVPGRVRRLRPGRDVLLVSTGQQTARTLEAARTLGADGIDAGVVHVPSLKPVDAEAIAVAAAEVPLVVTTEEHTIHGGLGGLVAEIVTSAVPRPVERIGIADTWGESAPSAWLLDQHGLTPERIVARTRDALARRS